jgi:PBP4 family serine-type D-alanyl-D-alanine carboxypeptidase
MPRTAKVLQKHEGLPLAEIVRVMNQESNNVIAEMINKSLGAEFVSLPGTREKGLSVLRAFLVSEMGFPEGSFSIGDSSGLSTDNRLSARQVCKVLGRFYAREKTRSAFVPTLARQGHHPHAMNPVPPDSIKVYVKTGTLSVQGVNSIAGYCMADRTGEIFTFAILASRKKTGPMTYSGTLTNPLVGAMVKAFGTALEDKQDDPSR